MLILNTLLKIQIFKKIKFNIEIIETKSLYFIKIWYISFMRFFYLVFVILLALTSQSQAYLDPGTLSMILSVIFGIFASSLIFIKDILNKIKKLFKKKKK